MAASGNALPREGAREVEGLGGGHATPRVSGQRFEIVVSIPPVLGGDKCLKSLGQALPARESQKGPEEAGESQRKSQREPERERERERERETD